MSYSVGMNNVINSNVKVNSNNNIQKTEEIIDNPIDFSKEKELEEATENETTVPPMTTEEMREELQKTKDEQGIVGKTWDAIKNKVGFLSKIGMKGSEEIEEIIAKAEAGEITEKEAQEALEKYKKNQSKVTEIVLDTATVAIVSAVCLLSGPMGWSIGVTLAVAAATGAISRLGLGATEAATNNVEGDYTMENACRDFTRGGILGFLTGLGKVMKTKFRGKGKIATEILKRAEKGPKITVETLGKNIFMSPVITAGNI